MLNPLDPVSEDSFYVASGAPPPPARSASDPVQIERGEQREARERRERLADLREALASPHCRRFLTAILAQCGIYHATESSSPAEMARLEGKRMIGLWIIDRLNLADPTAYLQIQKDLLERKRAGLLAEIQARQQQAAVPRGTVIRRLRSAIGI